MNEDRIKHLEFIENNIARMNNCSFQLKSWMITVNMALLALFASSKIEGITPEKRNVIYILISIIPTFLFWVLDSFYLQKERKFRALYNDVAEITPKEKRTEVKLFEIPLCKYKDKKCRFWNSLWSPSTGLLYCPIIVGLAIASFLLW